MTSLLNVLQHHRQQFMIKYQDVADQRLRTFSLQDLFYMLGNTILITDQYKDGIHKFPVTLTDFLAPIVSAEPQGFCMRAES